MADGSHLEQIWQAGEVWLVRILHPRNNFFTATDPERVSPPFELQQ
jgi:hypothetical protein